MKFNLFILVTASLQAVLILLFLLFVRYDPKLAQRSASSVEEGNQQIKDIYPMFQDVHVMIFIGFGFLMTFLKRYGLSAVSLNLMCSALAIQVFTIVYGLFHLHCEDSKGELGSNGCGWPKIDVNLETMIGADFATAAVLISFGVVLGVASPLQLVIMTVVETVLFVVNEVIGRDYLGAVDAGDTIFVHVFGAYFGLAVAKVLYKAEHAESSNETSSRTSDLFSLIGTMFLWVYWPSFNGGAASSGDAQQRAVLNTYYSLCACVLSTLACSALISPGRKLNPAHLQNATLAGGVAVGACADMMLTPGGAMVAGAAAGALSCAGFEYVQPALLARLRIHDSCGVNNLHGMPGLLGGLLSVLLAGIASEASYDKFAGEGHKSSLHEIFPALAPEVGGHPGGQALSQLLALLTTLAAATVGGCLTGLLLHWVGKLEAVQTEQLFLDSWNIAGEEEEEDTSAAVELRALLEDFKAKQQTETTNGISK